MNVPVLIVGGGGHTKVLIEALRMQSANIIGILEANPAKIGTAVSGIPVIGNDNTISKFPAESILLVNGVGSVSLPGLRKAVFEKFKEKGFAFRQVVHPSAVTASDLFLDEGAQVMAGAVIQPGSRIGKNVIVNTSASVDHDCTIGDHVHLSPGVTLSGGVRIGAGCHIGTGATIIQGITIGENCLIASGSVVISNVRDGVKVAGLPAREILP